MKKACFPPSPSFTFSLQCFQNGQDCTKNFPSPLFIPLTLLQKMKENSKQSVLILLLAKIEEETEIIV